jgi:MFS transporter, DHA2 family, multidrug resistance protein
VGRGIGTTPVTTPETRLTTVDVVPAGRREWIGLGVLVLACALLAMNLTVLSVAVPAISADLQPSGAQLLWILDIYGFLLAGSLITMGSLGDRIGRRRLLMVGAAAFGVASLLAAISTSAERLILSRALLGIAGATLAPSTLALIRHMFVVPRQHTLAIAVWVASFVAGAALGPVLGGLLLELFWWGALSLIALPVMVLVLWLGPRVLPEYRDPDGAARLDLVSATLSLAAVLAVVYGLKEIAQDGLSPVHAFSIVAGLAIAVVFVRRQRRLTDPLVDLSLFRNRVFSAALIISLFSFFLGLVAFVFPAQQMQLTLGMSPRQAGLWSLPSAAALIIGCMATPALSRRARAGTVIAVGMAVAAIGFGLLTQLPVTDGLALLVTGSVIFSIGLAPVYTLAADLVVATAPPRRAGTASALSETSFELGGALGIAILGAIVIAAYRDRLADTVPSQVPPHAAEAAMETPGGALAVMDTIPDQFQAGLLDATRTAFTYGLQLAFAASAVMALALAIVTVLLFRWPGGRADSHRKPDRS